MASKIKVPATETTEQKLARLQAELKAAMDVQAAELAEKHNRIKEFVNTLPKELGVSSLADVRNIINQVEKGTLGTVASDVTRTRTVLTEAQRKALVAEYKIGGEENQRSKLIERYSISAATLQNILKENGLTVSRSPAAPAAPAPAAS